jgi:hypothetical protein
LPVDELEHQLRAMGAGDVDVAAGLARAAAIRGGDGEPVVGDPEPDL